MTFFSCATFLGGQCWVGLENPSLSLCKDAGCEGILHWSDVTPFVHDLPFSVDMDNWDDGDRECIRYITFAPLIADGYTSYQFPHVCEREC